MASWVLVKKKDSGTGHRLGSCRTEISLVARANLMMAPQLPQPHLPNQEMPGKLGPGTTQRVFPATEELGV